MLGGNMAFRKSALDQVGGFDERFGAGQQWSSGEETDMFFRMSHQKMKLVYAPQVVVYHPREDVGHTPQSLRTKLYAYGKGNGALFAKHIHTYHSLGLIASYLWSLVKPLLRIVQYFCMLQCNTALLHRAVLTGRVVGYWEYLRGHR
jgi:GT2 family glycosyltransferase